jgi:hypothetical protein
VERAEAAQHAPGLVGLQATDEVPVERLEIGELLLLGTGLLQPALTETAHPRRHGPPQGGGGLALAHRQQTAAGGQIAP